jgi:hypothetical protein
MRDELLNGTLLTSLAHAHASGAASVRDYNAERPFSSVGYATPAAFAGHIERVTARACLGRCFSSEKRPVSAPGWIKAGGQVTPRIRAVFRASWGN